jgi:hypothetical protein
MKKPEGERGPRPPRREAASYEAEEAVLMKHAKEALVAARGAFPLDGDPFTDAAMHSHVRRTLRTLAHGHESFAAFVRRLALAGAEVAHMALTDLIAKRRARGEPVGPALTAYDRPPRFRRPAVRPPSNFMANFVIICLLIDLMQQFPGLRLRRNEASERPSACSIVAAVLEDADLGEREEAIRKIWDQWAPIVAPDIWRATKK